MGQSIGFGVENIGVWCLNNAKITATIVILSIATALFGAKDMRLDGDPAVLFQSKLSQYEEYKSLRENFGDFDQDFFFLVEAEDLTDPEIFSAFQEFQLELTLSDVVKGAYSIFTLRQWTKDDAWEPAIPAGLETQEEIQKTLKNLRDSDPVVDGLMSPDNTTALVVVFINRETEGEAYLRESLAELEDIAKEYQGDGLNIQVTGSQAFVFELSDAMRRDLVVINGGGILIGVIVAFLIFRSLISTLIVAVPPTLSVLLLLGVMGLLGVKLNLLSVIIPILTLIITYTESLHMAFHWQNKVGSGMDVKEALFDTIKATGPACVLASITTMIAFLTLLIAPNATLNLVGLFGALGIFIGFLSIIIILPLIALGLSNLGIKVPPVPQSSLFSLTNSAAYSLKHFARPITLISIILFLSMTSVHFLLEPRFSFTETLNAESKVGNATKRLDEKLGGILQVFAVIPLKENAEVGHIENREKGKVIQGILSQVFGENKIVSLVNLDNPYGPVPDSYITSMMENIPEELRIRFVSKNNQYGLVTIFSKSAVQGHELVVKIDKAQALLDANEATKGIVLTGLSKLAAQESLNIIRTLQIGLVIAVLISLIIIGIAFKSPLMGFICLVPNFLPILGAELYLYLSGAHLQMITVIALTIAFGVAVDDTIHMLNYFRSARQKVDSSYEAMQEALKRIGPVLIATTVILCSGISLTFISILPNVSLFGGLCFIILFLALLSVLYILPSLYVRFEGISQKSQ